MNLITLYKFMEHEHAVTSISQDRIKVSVLDTLNDPYEMLPCLVDQDGTHLPAHQCREVFLKRIAAKHGIICLSATVSDPLLWAHYAARHTGVAFEFEFPMSGAIIPVTYSNDRVKIPVADVDDGLPTLAKAFESLLGRKFTSWSYEQEYRSVVPISEVTIEDGLHFKAIPREYFKRVILGYDCPLKEEAIRCILDSSGFQNVGIAHACLSDQDFTMVVQQSPPAYPERRANAPSGSAEA